MLQYLPFRRSKGMMWKPHFSHHLILKRSQNLTLLLDFPAPIICWLSVPHVQLNYRRWYTWFEVDLQEVSFLDLVVFLYCKKLCSCVITIFQEDVLCSQKSYFLFLVISFLCLSQSEVFIGWVLKLLVPQEIWQIEFCDLMVPSKMHDCCVWVLSNNFTCVGCVHLIIRTTAPLPAPEILFNLSKLLRLCFFYPIFASCLHS